MPKYRLKHEDFKDIIVNARTKEAAINKLIHLLKEKTKKGEIYGWSFIKANKKQIRIRIVCKGLGSCGQIICCEEADVEEVFERNLEKEEALEKEREKIEEFCAIPANEVEVSDVTDFFGADWYSMTLRGQKQVTQRIEEVMDMDTAAASQWLDNILYRWHYRSKFIHWD